MIHVSKIITRTRPVWSDSEFNTSQKHVLTLKSCFPFQWSWQVSRLAVYTGSETYRRELCLFMSLPLTTSVLTQRQETINTAKRCNVRRGEGGGGGGERKQVSEVLDRLFSTLQQEAPAFLELKKKKKNPCSWQRGRDSRALFLEDKQRPVCLRVVLHAGKLNRMWLWAVHSICRLGSLTDKTRPRGSQEVDRWWTPNPSCACHIILTKSWFSEYFRPSDRGNERVTVWGNGGWMNVGKTVELGGK